MRILLRDKKSGQFFVRADVWTADPVQAADFASGLYVLQTGRHLAEEVEAFYSFEDKALNFSIPVSAIARQVGINLRLPAARNG